MTPLDLEILLHYSCHTDEDFRCGDMSAPAVREAIDWFVDDVGMLEPSFPGAAYKLTEKGRFFVAQLCDLPLPVSKWVMP